MSRERTMPILEIGHDFVFALNIALLVGLVNVRTPLSVLEPNLTFRIDSALGLDPHRDLGGYIAFFLLAASLAIILSISLWMLGAFVNPALRLSYGFVSLIALPLSWLVSASIYGVLPGLPNPPHPWLSLELVAVAVCSVLFFIRRWPLPNWASVALMGLHFAFWGWLFLGGLYFWLAPAKIIFPLVSFGSCIIWAIYVSRRKCGFAVPAET